MIMRNDVCLFSLARTRNQIGWKQIMKPVTFLHANRINRTYNTIKDKGDISSIKLLHYKIMTRLLKKGSTYN